LDQYVQAEQLSGGVAVSSRLDHIKDWKTLAAQCGYSLQSIAQACGMSRQQLRRYFKQHLQVNPKQWLDMLRWADACARLRRGEPIKSVSIELGFKHVSHFTKFVRAHANQTPREFQSKCSSYITNVPVV
jgi:AraC-like DNA-binding protein